MLRRSSRSRSNQISTSKNRNAAVDPLAHALRPVVESLERRQMLTVTPAGLPDSTFGNNGSVTTDFNNAHLNDDASTILVQNVAGSTKYVVVGTNTSTNAVEIARYNRDGTLDNSFGVNGTVTTALAGFQGANAAAFAANGDILVAGSVQGGTSAQDFVLVRYSANGSLQTSWGTGGSVAIDFNGKADVANAVAVQPSGQIVVSGYATVGTRRELAVALVSDSGTVGAKTAVPIGASGNSQGNGVAVQSDGSFAVAGQNTTIGNVQSAVIVKFTALGAVDTSFGASGIAQNSFGGGAAGNAIAVGPGNQYYLAGGAQGDFLLARYTSSGVLDSGFNGTGYTLTAIGSDGSQAYAVAVQPNGKVDVAGVASDSFGHDEFGVVRVNSNGTLDSAFGTGGVAETTFGTNQDADARAIAFDDQKIVAAGFSATGTSGDDEFSLERLVANNAPASTGDATLDTIDQNQSNSPGDAVSAVVARMGITDADGDTVGIAITSIDNSHGTWQYSTNGGTSWTAIPVTTSATSALLLDQSTGNRVRFVPANGFSGNAALAVRPWDMTRGTSGGTFDTTGSDANNLNAFGASRSATETVGAAPANMYVNSTWSGSAQGATVTDSLGNTHTYGIDAFATVTEAVNLIATNGTVHVDGGTAGSPLTYSEDVVLVYSQTLSGYGAATPTMTAPTTATNGIIVSVQAANVTVENLNFVVDQPHAAAAVGAIDVNAGAHTIFDGLKVLNNTITSTGTGGKLQIDGSLGVTNKYSAGVVVLAGAGATAPNVTVDGNQILPSLDMSGNPTSTVGRGIWASQTQGGFDGNTIEAVSFQDALLTFMRGPTTFDNNTLHGTGLTITEPNSGATTDVSGNTFAPTFGVDDGEVVIRHDYNATAAINIHDNSFSMLSNTIGVLSTQSIGVTVNHNTFAPAAAAVNTIAVYLDTQGPSSSEPAPFVSASIAISNNSFNSAAGLNATAIYVADHDSGTNGPGNDFGAIAVNGNTFGKNLGEFIVLAPGAASTSYSGDVVSAIHPTAANVNIDATNNNFGVSSGDTTLTNADYYEVEDKIVDGVDYSGAGLVRIESGHVFVTPSSYLAAAGSSAPSIQRGVDEASSGDTVNVEAGSYSVNGLNISKAITLSGAFAGTPGTDNSRGTGETILNGPASQSQGAFTLNTTAPVTITGFELDGSKIFNNEPGASDIHIIDNVLNLQAMAGAGETNMIFSDPKAIQLKDNEFTTTGENPSNSAVMQVAGDYAGGADTTNLMDITGNTFNGVANPSDGQSTLQLNLDNVQGNVQGNAFNGVDIGILIAEHTGNLTVTGNTFDNITRGSSENASGSYGAGIAIYNPVFDHGAVTISNNTFENSDTGVRTSTDGSGSFTLNSPALTVSGNHFSGNIYNVVDKFAGEIALAGDNVLDGTTLSSASTAQLYAVEDKILDGVDHSGWGLVRLKAENVYVTPNSFTGPATDDTGAISRALALASSGDTVNLEAGTYYDELDITKSVTIKGPNAGVNPNTGVRGAEAIIEPSVSDPDPNSATSSSVVYVEANNVTIDGVVIDGHNANLSGGVTQNGVQVNAIEGIGAYGGIANFTAQNDVIRNMSYAGLDMYNYNNNGGVTSGNTIADNLISNIGYIPYGFGDAILVYNNFYANITDNVMTGVRLGIQTGNFFAADTGNSHTFSGNQITATRKGIWDNLSYGTATGFVISNNDITGANETGASSFVGIDVTVQQTAVSPTITGNTITVPNTVTQQSEGYELWDNTTSAGITVSGGSVDGAKYGVFANNYDGYQSSSAGSEFITINGVAINNSTSAGVYVKDNGLNSDPGTINVNLTGGTVVNGGAASVVVEGAKAGVTFTGTDAAPGAYLLGPTGDYITIKKNSNGTAPALIDAQHAAFGADQASAIVGDTVTNAQAYAIEDKVTDAIDAAGLGLVRLKAGNVYVAQSSESPNAGAVQRGVDAAQNGDVVNVQAGTFSGPVAIVNKNITLDGSGQGQTKIVATNSLPAQSDGKNAVVFVNGGTDTIENLTVDAAGKGNVYVNGLVGVDFLNAGGTLDHVTVKDARNTPLAGNQGGLDVLATNTDSVSRTVNITNDTISGYQKNGITIKGAGLTANITGNTVTGAGDTTAIAQNGIEIASGAGGSITNNIISGNEYSGSLGGSDQFNDSQSTGVILFASAPGVAVSGNTIDGNDIGIYNNSDNATITNNQLGNTAANRYEGIVEDQGSSTISGNSIKGGNLGIDVVSYDGNTGPSSATITGNTVSGATVGVEVIRQSTTDPVASATIISNTLTNNTTGVEATNATITVGSGNTITGGATGLSLNGSTAGLTGNTLSDLSFSGQSGKYVALSNGAESGQTLDATGATFDSVGPTDTTLSNLYGVEDKLTDHLDDGSIGYVKLRNGAVYVAQSSETPNAGAVQRGVDVAQNGDVVNIQAGSFSGPVKIVNKNITLEGAGQSQTTIVAPANIPATSDAKNGVIYVNGGTDTIENLTVDGANEGSNYANGFVGIDFSNGGGTVDNVTVKNVENASFNGVQNGVAVYAKNTDSASRTLNINHDTINTYQKGGIVALGSGLTVHIDNNVVAGNGDTTQIAQNGIEVGNGATGSITNNTVSGNEYSGSLGGSDQFNDTQSTGLLLFGTSGLTVSGNTIDGNDIGIYNNSDNATISNNQLGNTTVNRYEGIVEDQGSSSITGNSIKGGNLGIDVVSYDGNTGASSAVIDGNTITGASVGIEAIKQSTGDPAVEVLAQNNTLTGNTEGVQISGGATVDLGDNNHTNSTGLGSSVGNNDLRGYTGVAGNYAIDDENTSSQPGVLAQNNNFGKVSANNVGVINNVIKDHSDNASLSSINFTPPENVAAAPSVVYVNSTWATAGFGNDPDGAGPATSFGYDAFATVQDAINAVATGGTVYVEGGTVGSPLTYAEDVVISRSMTLSGLGAVNPTLTAPSSVTNGIIVSVQAANVTVENLNIVVDQPNAAAGIAAIDPVGASTSVFDGLKVLNNVISSTGTGGKLQQDASYGPTNKYSGGIVLLAGAGGSAPSVTVDGNQIEGSLTSTVGRGIWANQIQGHFDNNTIEAIAYQDALLAFMRGPTTFDGNTLLGTGLTITEPNAGASIDVSANNFTPAFGVDDGALVIRHDYNASAPINIHDNTFTMLSNTIGVLSTQSIGVTVNHNTFAPAAGAVNTTAVYVDTQGPSTTVPPPFVSAAINVTNNSFSSAVGLNATAIYVADHDSGTNSPAADFGTIGVSGNTFDKNLADFIVLAPSQASATYSGDVVGAVHPSAANVNIDATSNTFGVTSGDTTLTNADFYEVEDKIVDGVDYTGAGLVRIKANTVFVTPNSFNTAAGTTTPSIQRAINAATAGDTVQVEAGTYSENVNVNKSVTIQGDGAGTILTAASGNDVTVTASNVTLKDLSVSGGTRGVDLQGATAGDTLKDITVSGQSNFAIEIDNGATVTNLSLDGVTASANTTSGVGFNVASTGQVDGLTITNSHFDNNAYGLETQIASNSTGNSDAFTHVNVSNSTFNNDTQRAIYVEKLNHATFDNITVNNSGTANGANAVDVNLKGGNYGDITIENSTFTNDGNGGAAVTIKGRNDGAYTGNPGTLDGVTLSNDTISSSSAAVDLDFENVVKNVSLSGVQLNGTVAGLSDSITAPGTLSVGDTDFNATLGVYIAVGSNNNVDATGATFGSVTPADNTLSHLYGVEDKIHDHLDNGSVGYVQLRTGNVYVAHSSESPNAGAIQRGIDVAVTGDTVHVQSGTYTGSPQITKSITLAGDGAATTTLNLLPDGSPGTAYLAPLYINAQNVTLSGFTIVGNDAVGNGLANSDIYVNSGAQTVNITNNVIKVGKSGPGSTGDDGFGIITNYNVDANQFIGTLNVTGNTFTTTDGAADRAFYINTGVSQFNFENNTITGNFTRRAFTEANNAMISGNEIMGTGTSQGIGAFGDTDPTKYGHATFQNNDIQGVVDGISILSAQNVTVENNTFENDGTGVLIEDEDGSPAADYTTDSIVNNGFETSVTTGVDNETTTTIDASSNWWGTANGPTNANNTSDGTPKGSAVVGPVTFAPWLTQGDQDANAIGFQPVAVDSTPPNAPSTPVLKSTSDTGVAGDNITSNKTPHLTGTAEPGSTVRIFDGATLIGTGFADATSGAYDIQVSSLGEGEHTITAVAVDGSGNTSNPSGTLTLDIDSQSPAPTITDNSTGHVEGTPVVLVGTVNDPSPSFGTPTYLWHVVASNGQTIANATTKDFSFTPVDNGTYTVTYTVTDEAGNVGSATDVITITNAAPSNLHATASSPINENGTTTLNGSFADPGVNDTHTVTIDWGDGTLQNPDVQTINLAAGVTTFSTTHQYLNNNPGNAPFAVSISVADNFNDSTSTSTSVEVDNVAPSNLNVTASSPVNENGSTTLGGSFTDPGTLDTHTVTIDWGDGSANTTLNLATGVTSFSGVTHQYLNNKTANAPYTVSITVVDSDAAGTSTSTSVEVDNVAPSNLNLTASSPVNENGSTTLGGTFTDPGTLDTHHVVIDWGDGSPTTTLDLAAGVTSFSGVNHQYLNNQAANAPYTVSVSVTDSDSASTNATTSVEVDNVGPSSLNLTPSSPINENGSTSLSGTFTDPGTLDTHHVVIDWGDGSATTTFDLAAGVTGFSGKTHQYLNNQAANAPYNVSVTVTDSDNASTNATTSVEVDNVAPSNLNLTASSPVNENGSTTLSGSFIDPGTLDTHAVVINWGDGSPLQTINLAAGVTSFSGVGHQYLNNKVGNAPYTVSVSVTDSDNASTSNSTSVTVTNVAPSGLSVSATPSTINENGSTSLSGSFTDPGTLDTHSVVINWGDGSGLQTVNLGAGVTSFAGVTHQYVNNQSGNTPYTVSVTVTDSDGASTSNTTSVTVNDVEPTVALAGSKSDNSNSTANAAEGSTFTLTLAPVSDPGYAGGDRVQSYFIIWGDGQTQSIPVSQIDQTTGGTVTHVYQDGTVAAGTTTATDEIQVDIIDNDGYHASAGTLGVVITNVAPTASFSGSNSVPEGSGANVAFFSQHDVSPIDQSAGFTYSYDFNNDGIFEVIGSSSSSMTVPPSYLSQPGTYTIVGRITDKDGGFTDYTHQITVTNVPPSVNTIANATIGQNTTFTQTGSFTDPGNDAPWQVYVNYDYNGSNGNGTLLQSGSSKSFSLSHVYNTPGTYTVLVTVIDSQGATGQRSFTVTVNATNFQITNFTPTGDGFEATFNRAANTGVLNLYAGPGGLYGAADVTVVGAHVGAVKGSMVWDPTSNTVDFVATSGVLQPDTYTVTFVSGATAWEDTNGNTLNGGSNDVRTINVSSVGNVVGISSFARGPGQDVNLPATANTGIPITISDGTGVTAVDFNLFYNPSLFTYISLAKASLPSGWALTTNTSVPGEIQVTLSGTTALGSGPQTILDLFGSIPTNATIGSDAEMKISGLKINETQPATARNGIEAVAYLGDASGNGHYSTTDASLISNVVVHNTSGFDAYPQVDPVIIADVTGDGTLSGQDASLVAQASVGMPVSQLPAIPAGGGQSLANLSQAAGRSVSIPTNTLAYRNGNVSVPINIDDDTGITGANFQVTFDSTQLSLVADPNSATNGSLDPSSDWTVVYYSPSAGVINVGIYSPTGKTLTGGSGSLINVNFKAAANATLGSTPVTVTPQDGGLNEGGISMTTTNGSVLVDLIPEVTNVVVSGSNWKPAFLTYLQSLDANNVNGYSIPAGANQLKTLPWTNLNQIAITFNQDVTVTQGMLQLVGVNTANYSITGFSYNSTTHTAMWTLSAPIAADKLLIDLSTSVVNTNGSHLSGAWTDGTSSYPSGDGQTSSNFIYRFNVLPGDVNQNGTENAGDTGFTQAHQASSTTVNTANYSIFADVDGSGAINAGDTGQVQARQATTLPAGNPTVPGSQNAAPASVVAAAAASPTTATAAAPAIVSQPVTTTATPVIAIVTSTSSPAPMTAVVTTPTSTPTVAAPTVAPVVSVAKPVVVSSTPTPTATKTTAVTTTTKSTTSTVTSNSTNKKTAKPAAKPSVFSVLALTAPNMPGMLAPTSSADADKKKGKVF